MRYSRVAIPFVLAGSAFAGKIQKPDLVLPPTSPEYRDKVVDIFLHSYNAYREYAWGHDDVAPISKSFVDSRNGWGATIVDAMSTMHIMGLEELFLEAVEFSGTIDFSKSKIPERVSVFETTIRYLGGFLSAYELSDEKHPILLQKAKEVAEKMSFAWSQGNVIPYGFLDFETDTIASSGSNIAEAGTLALEWETLGKHTGNQTYTDYGVNALRHIATLPAPLPGLAAQGIDPRTGEFIGGYVTWGGGSDSYFEYLIKHARLSNTDDPIYADTWLTAIDSSIKHLLKTSSVGNNVYLADYDSQKRIRYVGSHLACFHGGNWLLGGRLLNNQTIIDHALDLVDGCWNTYSGTGTTIGPEGFGFITAEGNFTGSEITPEQAAFNEKNGFYIRSSYYILRPEVLESNFIAWRVTGDYKYLERAEKAVDAFIAHLKVPGGYAGLEDVDDVNSIQVDDTESFWFAEVLKYLYLTFDDPAHISLDEYIFNTEAHPFKAPPPKESYSDKRLRQPTGTFKLRTGVPLPAISPNAKVPSQRTPQ